MADHITTEQVPNPTGKGGFGDHPENRNPGGWRKEVSFSYQYKRFMSMSPAELKGYTNLPDDKRTVVEDLAYKRVVAAQKSLADVKEITDRTEGKAPQSITVTNKQEQADEWFDSLDHQERELADGYAAEFTGSTPEKQKVAPGKPLQDKE